LHTDLCVIFVPDTNVALPDLNRALNYYFDMSFFVTMFYGVVDPEEGVLDYMYMNAGHVPALLLAEDGVIHSSLGSTGIPAGSGYGCRYGSQRIGVSPTDLLLLYTHGVTDAVVDGGPLGIEGLHEVLFNSGARGAVELVDHIHSELTGRLQARQIDDIALLAVSFEGVGAGRTTLPGGNGGQQHSLPAESA